MPLSARRLHSSPAAAFRQSFSGRHVRGAGPARNPTPESETSPSIIGWTPRPSGHAVPNGTSDASGARSDGPSRQPFRQRIRPTGGKRLRPIRHGTPTFAAPAFEAARSGIGNPFAPKGVRSRSANYDGADSQSAHPAEFGPTGPSPPWRLIGLARHRSDPHEASHGQGVTLRSHSVCIFWSRATISGRLSAWFTDSGSSSSRFAR